VYWQIQHIFPDTNFRGGNEVTSVSQRWGTELHQILGEHTSLVDALLVCIARRCQVCCFVLELVCLKFQN